MKQIRKRLKKKCREKKMLRNPKDKILGIKGFDLCTDVSHIHQIVLNW